MSLIARLGASQARFAQRITPDPFVLAVLLTIAVMAGGWSYASYAAGETVSLWTYVLEPWIAGFANVKLLAFGFQMALVLVTGHALASSAPTQRIVGWLASLPKTSAGAAAIVALSACLAAIVHWGLGAIVGAFVARDMARTAKRNGRRFHYPLMGAAAYAGLAVWHGGLSGSAPLKVAEKGHFLQSLYGVVPVEETIFSASNLITTAILTAAIVALFWLLAPRGELDPSIPDGPPDQVPAEPAPSEDTDRRDAGLVVWLQESPVLSTVLGGGALLILAMALATDRAKLDINIVNLIVLFLGILLQGSLGAYGRAITDGAKSVGGILLQFPFYFGILHVMGASGLIGGLSEAFSAVATETTFPILAFVSAGIVNLFVPSGGGQWAIQGEILARTGSDLGVSPETTIMAFAYGDAWTNMLQPFWALPLLGIMGLRARDIMGYASLVFVLMGVLVPILLLVVF